MATTINSNTTDGVVITPDTSGEIELQADGVTKAKITANGLQDNNGNSLRGGSYRNLIINGDMKVAQRGTSKTGLTNSVKGYVTVDRWRFDEAGSPTCVFTQSQDTDVPTGQGFSNSLKLECTTTQTSLGNGDLVYQRYRIEAQNLQHLKYGTSNAESLTLSFWVKSNKTGTYIVEIYQEDAVRVQSQSYTIDTADTWEKKTITYAGDVNGTINNDNGAGLDIFFTVCAGSDFTSGTLNTSWKDLTFPDDGRDVGQVNFADSTSNYINITGVQLEVGEGASDFEHLPYDVQLQRCQRYFTKTYEGAISAANAVADTGHERLVLQSDGVGMLTSYFPVHMRTTPSIVIRNTSDGATGQITGVSGVDYAGSVKGGNNQNVTIGPTNIGDRTRVLGFHYEASAEL